MIKNLVNGKCYIGSTYDFVDRFRKHRYCLRNNKHHSKILQSSWSKYGENYFVFGIIEFVESIDNLTIVEQKWMDHYTPEYNILKFAKSSKGFKHSQETKDLIREMNLGDKNPRYGIKSSKNVSRKSRYKRVGVNSVLKPVIRISKDGSVKEYDSITMAARDLGVERLGGIQKVLYGRGKSYKGFIFRFKSVS